MHTLGGYINVWPTDHLWHIDSFYKKYIYIYRNKWQEWPSLLVFSGSSAQFRDTVQPSLSRSALDASAPSSCSLTPGPLWVIRVIRVSVHTAHDRRLKWGSYFSDLTGRRCGLKIRVRREAVGRKAAEGGGKTVTGEGTSDELVSNGELLMCRETLLEVYSTSGLGPRVVQWHLSCGPNSLNLKFLKFRSSILYLAFTLQIFTTVFFLWLFGHQLVVLWLILINVLCFAYFLDRFKIFGYI